MYQGHRAFAGKTHYRQFYDFTAAILRWIRSGYYRKSGFAQQIDLDIYGRMIFAKTSDRTMQEMASPAGSFLG